MHRKHYVTVREAREISRRVGALILWRAGMSGEVPLTDDDLCEVLYEGDVTQQ